MEIAKDLLGLIHTTVCGPFRTVSREGVSYFITFTNDFNHYGYVYSMKHKHEVFEIFKVFQNEVENQLGKKIKAIRSDRGGEYMSHEILDHMKNCVLWGYALKSAARILNMVRTKKVDKTPYELWHGKAPKLSYLRVWGCEALVKRDTPEKLDSRSINCIFVGYPKETMGYYFYYPLKNKIFVARNAELFKNSLTLQEPYSEIVPIRRSNRIPQAPDQYGFYVDVEEHELGDLNEPSNYKAELSDPEYDKWVEAMNAEMQSIKDNQVWRLVDLPPNGRTIGSKWIFKKKTNMDGNIHTFKAHLVAKYYTQTYGVDYGETFSPIAYIRAIRILLAIAMFYEYDIWQMNVKTTFLNGHLSEDVYMVQPEGFVDPKHPKKVCKLQWSIYGLKLASKSWNKRFDEEIKKVDLGEAAYILGIKITRDRSKRLIALCQSSYLDKLLKRFKMENSKCGNIPMQEKPNLSKAQVASTPEYNLCSQFSKILVNYTGLLLTLLGQFSTLQSLNLCSGSATEEQNLKKEFQFSLVGNSKLNDVDVPLEAETKIFSSRRFTRRKIDLL
ncbi:retrotransposon protein, putative, ty1-copia subclass [Tanacetum coccineum]